jgi:hypothetical protein
MGSVGRIGNAETPVCAGDQTTAFDDALTERLQHCTGCGAAAALALGQWIGLRAGQPILTVAVGFCPRCWQPDRRHAVLAALDAVLLARYAPMIGEKEAR